MIFKILICSNWRLIITEVSSILALRRDRRLLKAPPYLSAILVSVGIVWLLLLPLNEYSRYTYISENALLPGQVHTYFGGSEQQIFNAYKREILDVAGREQDQYSELNFYLPSSNDMPVGYLLDSGRF